MDSSNKFKVAYQLLQIDKKVLRDLMVTLMQCNDRRIAETRVLAVVTGMNKMVEKIDDHLKHCLQHIPALNKYNAVLQDLSEEQRLRKMHALEEAYADLLTLQSAQEHMHRYLKYLVAQKEGGLTIGELNEQYAEETSED